MRRSSVLLLVALLAGFAPPRAGAVDTSTIRDIGSFGLTECGAVFDARRNRLIVIGGHAVTSQVAVEVLDLSANPVWQRPAIAGTPADLGPHAIALMDSLRDRVLVVQPGATVLYSLSLAAPMTWSTIAPAGMPPFRDRVLAVYDPVRNRIVGHGGVDHDRLRIYDQTVSETWSLSLGASPAWSLLATAGGVPPDRAHGNAFWDPEGDRMLVYGGVSYGAQTSSDGADRDDLWQLSFRGGTPTWNPLLPLTALPPARRGASAVLDREHRQLVVFGGYHAGTILDDLWTFDLSRALAWQQNLEVGPAARFSAATAYDVNSQRMLVAGGSGSLAAFPELGDVWWFRLGPTTGPLDGRWSREFPTGNRLFGVQFGGYDPFRRGFLGLSEGLPWMLSTDDVLWHAVPPPAPAFGFFLGPYLDPVTNTYYGVPKRGDLGLLDTLYTLRQGQQAEWTATAIPGPLPPNANQIATTWFDAKRGRILMIGLAKAFTRDGATFEFWTLSLGPTPTWTRVAPSTPLGIRATLPMLDTRRDRLVFFGGKLVDAFGFPYAALGDLYQLDLNTLAFRALAATGIPPSDRGSFGAAYDSTRDRCIIAGGANGPTSLPGVYSLQFGPADAEGSWFRNDVIGPPVATDPRASIQQIAAAFDVERDIMYLADDSRLTELRFDQSVVGLDVSGPPAAVWRPGSALPLSFSATQLVPGARRYSWSVRSERAWPEFPLTGFLDFPDATTITFPVGIPIPDTAAAGSNTLTLVMRDLAPSGIADSCTVAIGDVTSHVLWSAPQVTVSGAGVHLSWPLSDPSATMAHFQRRLEGADWTTLADVLLVGSPVFEVTDPAPVRGVENRYRAGITMNGSDMWSDEIAVQVPDHLVPLLSFATAGARIVHGALDVTFTLPSDAPATLDLLDLSGRRLASRSPSGAGPHTLTLALAGERRAGVYFVRLRQGGSSVSARVLLIP